ncbi:MAG: fumarate hydratase [Clostridia bacterium]|nr:fumarate hydratase [Clostridia bacterium]
MRIIDTIEIQMAIEDMCLEASCDIPKEIIRCYSDAIGTERNPLGRDVLGQLVKNAEIAHQRRIPSCQDTGMAVVFLEIGAEIFFRGKAMEEAVNDGIRSGYEKGFLRKSIVKHPLDRINTGDNTPAVIHYDFTKGNKLRIVLMPKGFGSENMSALAMLEPADGIDGVVRFIVDAVEKAGPNPCPPVFVGVGLGGTADKAMLMAKKALLRQPGTRSTIEIDALLEERLLNEINMTGIGPAGLGGSTTAFDVFVESYPTHIAGLPVAVNICCHALRYKERIL